MCQDTVELFDEKRFFVIGLPVKKLSLENSFAAPVYHEETVSSTMEIARSLAAEGKPHGTVITTDFQEAGRGRLRRPWLMEKGQNLMFTIILRYPDFPAIPPALTLKTGLAVSLAIEDFAPPLAGQVQVKWPNDVMIISKAQAAYKAQAAWKAAGILTEAEGGAVYIGIGVNLAQREFPGEIRHKARGIFAALAETSPEKNPGELFQSGDPRFILLEKILARLYGEIETGDADSWKPRLEARLFRRGEDVRFADGAAGSDKIVEGRLAGIGEGGGLLIQPAGENRPLVFNNGELLVY
ncbi:biotin--[acetyl-CoA-carboxylase] ligase [Spirochaetia bacterium]|nr:biotin--[acetyl-CoA-carboxylase] ligase [Spirochaetia bacterium]